VCIGNICRSPFAQGLFTKQMGLAGDKGFHAESAGLLALPGNSATFLAQKVAAEHSVDLTGHKAKHLSHFVILISRMQFQGLWII
jgi:protein-tyrosine phosphatase